MSDTLRPLLPSGDRPRHGTSMRLVFSVVLAVLATAAFLVPPAAVGSGAAEEELDYIPGEDSDVFPLVGEIDFRSADGTKLSEAPGAVGVDRGLGVAVFVSASTREVFLVDPVSLEQTVIPAPSDDHLIHSSFAEGDGVIVDDENHRLIMHGTRPGEVAGENDHDCAGGVPFGGIPGGVACSSMRGRVPIVTVADLQGEAEPVTRTLELAADVAGQQVEVEVMSPFDYHPATDRLYFVTEEQDRDTGGNEKDVAGAQAVVLHEISVADLVAADSDTPVGPTWSYEIGACERMSRQPGHLARSRRGDFVYLTCVGNKVSDLSLVDSNISPHGIVRVDLPRSESSDTTQFRSSFEPFVGDLSKGKVSGDRINDLVLIAASSGGPKLFVFDAYQQAWTGATELDGVNKLIPETNPDTARVYQFDRESGRLRITEGGRISVPNGVEYDLGIGRTEGSISSGTAIAPDSQPLFAPKTRRLFLHNARMCLKADADGTCVHREGAAGSPDGPPHFRVFEDRLPDSPAPEPFDFDSRTEDVPEGPGTFSSSSANARAFGARYRFVGGLESSRPANLSESFRNSTEGEVRTLPVGPATRDVFRARIHETTLSGSGTPTVTAAATGLHVGDQAESDLKRNTDAGCALPGLANRLGAGMDCFEPPSDEPDVKDRWDGSSWPQEYPEELRGHEANCGDFGGEPNEDAKPGAAVACDSETASGVAGTVYTSGDEELPLHVGYAESTTEVRLDESLGVVATATAVARDVELFGQISIGEVRSEATAVAHGRPGTAATELTREYRQVRVGDFACGFQDDDPCDLYEVAREINEVAPPRLVAYVPAQDTTLDPDSGDEPDDQPGNARVSNGTPGGAKAVVTEDPYDYQSDLTMTYDRRSELPGLIIVYYDDHVETSRHVLQLAAVELDANYTISSAPVWDTPDFGAPDDGGFGGGGFEGGVPVGGASGARQILVPPSPTFGEPAGINDGTSDEGTSDSELTDGTDGLGPDGSVGEGQTGTGGQSGRASTPNLDTATAPSSPSGGDEPEPDVAQPVAQDEQGGRSGGLGGLFLTRQRMGESLPLAVLWLLGTLPIYLAVRRRKLMTSSSRR